MILSKLHSVFFSLTKDLFKQFIIFSYTFTRRCCMISWYLIICYICKTIDGKKLEFMYSSYHLLFWNGFGQLLCIFYFYPLSTLTIICIQIFHNEAKSVPFTSILNRLTHLIRDRNKLLKTFISLSFIFHRLAFFYHFILIWFWQMWQCFI